MNVPADLQHCFCIYFALTVKSADLPFNLLVNGEFNQTVPAMIGVTQNEGGFFVLDMKGYTVNILNA